MSARSFEGFGVSVVEVLELEGCEVIDRAMRAFGVEPRHPPGGGCFDLADIAPWALVMDQLGLVQPDLRLREGVVVRVTHGPDGRVDAFLDEPVGERDRGVDPARVRVVRQPGEASNALAPAGENAISRQSSTRGVVTLVAACQPMIRRECASNTNAT